MNDAVYTNITSKPSNIKENKANLSFTISLRIIEKAEGLLEAAAGNWFVFSISNLMISSS
jgi:hypothetical protein